MGYPPGPIYIVELVGGIHDGKMVQVPEGHIRDGYILVPKLPAVTFTTGHDEMVSFDREKYQWDGTYSVTGARRFVQRVA